MGDFLKHLLSADERRVSTLVLTLFTFTALFFMVVNNSFKGIEVNYQILTMIKDIIITLIYIIGGVNAIPYTVSKIINKETKKNQGGI